MTLAIIAITPRGATLARHLASHLPESTVCLPDRFREEDGARYFSAPLSAFLPEAFNSYGGLICIMATGIVVRLLASCLRSKAVDPAVVVVDEAGQFAISLLSGHLGGANDLADEVAAALGGQAVITTATDVNGLPAWDVSARDAGLQIEPLSHLKRFNLALLEGQPIALVDPRQRLSGSYAGLPQVVCCRTFLEAEESGAGSHVYVTHLVIPYAESETALLLLRPRDLFLGIGCNRGTAAEEISAVVKQVLESAGLSLLSLQGVATIEEKRDEVGLNEFARLSHLNISYFTADQLNAVTVPSAPSLHALKAVGARGVCEPAALLAAQPGRLLIHKQKCGNVTVAVATSAGGI